MVNMKVEGNVGIYENGGKGEGPDAGGRNTKRAAAEGTEPRKG